jgi:NAD(P)-dependent dehydrogenase (short-subunit alcohol dehydrogenase family)
VKDLSGKVAFITGGAGGIGLAMAEAFGRRGVSVMLADVEAESLEAALEDLRSKQIKAEGVLCNVADRASLEAAAARTLARFGKVHVVCNNAGVGAGGVLGGVAPGDWDWVVDVNLKGVVYGVETFTPLMERQGEGGHFVNTASMAGLVSPPGMEPYSATKFAVVAMSEGWAAQLQPKGIGLSILCPAYVKTRIHESRRNRPATYGSAPPAAEDPDAPPSPVLSGMEASRVGERVVEAVIGDELYVFTHPEYRPILEARFQRILGAFDQADQSPALLGPAP